MGESGKLYFRIPDDIGTRTKLVEVIPDSWTWVNGILRAPGTGGIVAKDTGYHIKRLSSSPVIVGGWKPGGRQRLEPDTLGLVGDLMWPAFIEFDEAGMDDEPVSFTVARGIAYKFLWRNYTGALTFEKGSVPRESFVLTCRCVLNFRPWAGARFQRPEDGQQPARVKLEWDKEQGGTRKQLESIEQVCRELKLEEYTPQSDMAA